MQALATEEALGKWSEANKHRYKPQALQQAHTHNPQPLRGHRHRPQPLQLARTHHLRERLVPAVHAARAAAVAAAPAAQRHFTASAGGNY